MKNLSLLFLLKQEEILLAMKKRGFGVGLWNGVGGKQQPGESIEQTAIRECQEEIGVTPKKLEKVAELQFNYTDNNNKMLVYVYFCRHWQGEPTESEEMNPRWYNLELIPYEEMWPDDKYWLSKVLKGDKLKAKFYFDTNNKIIDYQLDIVDAL